MALPDETGNYANAFVGVTDVLQDWVATLPLASTESAIVGINSQQTGEMRVSFVQFSGEQAYGVGNVGDSVAVPSAGTGAGGKLSGSLTELNADLHWQRQNFIGKQTYVTGGLQKVADTYQAGSPKTDGRKKVLIVLTDSKILDAPQTYSSALTALDSHQMIVFGAVLRSGMDDANRQALEPILDKAGQPPTPLFKNMVIADLKAALESLCDPYDLWGQQIVGAPVQDSNGKHNPCTTYHEESPCNTDPGCVWNDQTKCQDSPCVLFCTSTECLADPSNSCGWDAALGECWKEMPCTYGTSGDCNADTECKWIDGCTGYAANCSWADTTKCIVKPCVPHLFQDVCLSDPVWDCTWLPASGTCIETPCQHTAQQPCAGDTECEWNDFCPGTAARCVPHPCQADNQELCKLDPACQWNTACERKTCAQYGDEACCAQKDNGDCTWDTGVAPGVCLEEPCKQYDNTDCDSMAECAWQVDKCVTKECRFYNDPSVAKPQCECKSDPDCYWVVASSESFCTADKYGNCPTLDIVVIAPGMDSMSDKFNLNHPHGFYGLMEVIRDWTQSLPLSNGIAGVQPPKADTKSVRVGLVHSRAIPSTSAPAPRWSPTPAAPGSSLSRRALGPPRGASPATCRRSAARSTGMRATSRAATRPGCSAR